MRKKNIKSGRPARHHRRVSQAYQKKSGRWVIGLHSVEEVFRVRPQAIQEMWLLESWPSRPQLKTLAAKWGRSIRSCSAPELDRLGSGHQGVAVCVSEQPEFKWDHLKQESPQLVLLLDGVQDPHNLGAILRSAWLLQAQAIFIPEHRASPLTSTAMKVASGGAEHVPVEMGGNLTDLISPLKELGFWVFGLSGQASQTLWQTQFPEKVALVVGSEDTGIRIPLERQCDQMIRLPQKDFSASLNASVALSIGMAEVLRQRTMMKTLSVEKS